MVSFFFLRDIEINIYYISVVLYYYFRLHPSPDCGPFRRYDHAYLLISDNVGDLPDWLENVLKYIGTPAIMVPVLMFLM